MKNNINSSEKYYRQSKVHPRPRFDPRYGGAPICLRPVMEKERFLLFFPFEAHEPVEAISIVRLIFHAFLGGPA